MVGPSGAVIPRVVGISGSPSRDSKTATLVEYLLARLAPRFSPFHLQLNTLDPTALVRSDPDETTVQQAIETINGADALIIASPIFKASFSGLLKMFLDLLPQYALAGKCILPIATGGSAAHMLAIDYALRPVLQSMGARHIIQSVFVRATDIHEDAGNLRLASDSTAHLNEAILHFEHAVVLTSGVAMLGHPRPNRS